MIFVIESQRGSFKDACRVYTMCSWNGWKKHSTCLFPSNCKIAMIADILELWQTEIEYDMSTPTTGQQLSTTIHVLVGVRGIIVRMDMPKFRS
jgi:hypothetical protein